MEVEIIAFYEKNEILLSSPAIGQHPAFLQDDIESASSIKKTGNLELIQLIINSNDISSMQQITYLYPFHLPT